MLSKLKKCAEKPSVMIPSMLLGILCGLYLPQFNAFYAEISHVYLSLLEMCVLPVMCTAIISSLGHLLHGGKTRLYLKRMIAIFALSLFGAALVALGLSLLLRPGSHLSEGALNGISQVILDIQGTVSQAVTTPMSIWSFLTNLVPNNVFNALSSGQNLAVLFVCILVGIAVGLQRNDSAKATLSVVHTIYLAFLTIIGWVMIGLPIGLFFLFASYLSSSGLEILAALSTLLLLVVCCGLVMMIIFTFIIRYRTGYSFFKVIFMLRQPLSLAFFTSSSLATMPMTLNVLQNQFKLNENITSLVIPLGTTFNQQASVIRYVCVALFILQMYGLHLDLYHVPFLMITAILAAISGSGLPGIAAITMSSFVLQSLGLPVAVGIILLTVVEPIIDPITTMVNVFGNCMAATLIANPPHTKKGKS